MLNIVMPTVKIFAWYALSEAILQTLPCSEDHMERVAGVERILAIRGDPNVQLVDASVRIKSTPDANCDASRIGHVISWSEGVLELPLTCFLSTSEVKTSPVPPWRCPTGLATHKTLKELLKWWLRLLPNTRTSHGERGMEGSWFRRLAGG